MNSVLEIKGNSHERETILGTGCNLVWYNCPAWVTQAWP
jgi:hypothetical protein